MINFLDAVEDAANTVLVLLGEGNIDGVLTSISGKSCERREGRTADCNECIRTYFNVKRVKSRKFV